MYSEIRKLRLIEEVIKIKSDSVLLEIEAVIKKAVGTKIAKQKSAHDFLGMFSEKDASLIDAAINEGCEQINANYAR